MAIPKGMIIILKNTPKGKYCNKHKRKRRCRNIWWASHYGGPYCWKYLNGKKQLKKDNIGILKCSACLKSNKEKT